MHRSCVWGRGELSDLDFDWERHHVRASEAARGGGGRGGNLKLRANLADASVRQNAVRIASVSKPATRKASQRSRCRCASIGRVS